MKMAKKGKKDLPRHIAIIMDGNGRWARKRGLPRMLGHRAGVEAVRGIVRACSKLGIEVLTLYAFSTGNRARPRREIDALMRLLREYVRREIDELNRNNVRFITIGRTGELPESVREVLAEAEKKTEANTGLILNIALNYGSREEIVDAVRIIGKEIKAGKRRVGEIDEGSISSRLYTAGLPDPDLLIRTSGEMRLSNYLLWQLSYSELYFTDKYWPDFKARDLEKAIADYRRRERRFGGIRWQR